MNISKIGFTGNIGKGRIENNQLKIGEQSYHKGEKVYMNFNKGQEKDVVQITGLDRIPPNY